VQEGRRAGGSPARSRLGAAAHPTGRCAKAEPATRLRPRRDAPPSLARERPGAAAAAVAARLVTAPARIPPPIPILWPPAHHLAPPGGGSCRGIASRPIAARAAAPRPSPTTRTGSRLYALRTSVREGLASVGEVSASVGEGLRDTTRTHFETRKVSHISPLISPFIDICLVEILPDRRCNPPSSKKFSIKTCSTDYILDTATSRKGDRMNVP
jgi:hypothetical protein